MMGHTHHHTDPVPSSASQEEDTGTILTGCPDSFMEMRFTFCLHLTCSHFFHEKSTNTASSEIEHMQSKLLFCTCLTQKFLSVTANAL